jgi:hypothetical protein
LNFLAMQKKNITIIRNVGSYLANDTAWRHRTIQSSTMSLWEIQTLFQYISKKM